jgi:dihydrofolate reductase
MVDYPTEAFRNIIIITSVDEFGGIDPVNYLPWIDQEDMQFFRETTLGHTVVMDDNVWNQLVTKPLDGRLNIVISQDLPKHEDDDYVVVRNFEEAMWAIWNFTTGHSKIFIIGGSDLYHKFLPFSRRVILTRVKTPYRDTDRRFPMLFKKKK